MRKIYIAFGASIGIIFITILIDQASLQVSPAKLMAVLIGTVGVAILLWQYILGFRPISHLLSKDLVEINTLHKNLGIWGPLVIILHPLFNLLAMPWLSLFPPNFQTDYGRMVFLGSLALNLLLLTWLISGVLRKRLSYRVWRRLHLLALPILPMVLVHALFLGKFVVYGGVTTVVWVGLVILSIIVLGSKVLSIFGIAYSKKYLLQKKSKLNESVWEYRFRPESSRLKSPRPGQFIYVKLSTFGESHPFTVAKFDEESGEIVLMIKTFGQYTKEMVNTAEASIAYLDGPHGVFTTDEAVPAAKRVFIAGGIGITPFVWNIDKRAGWLFFGNKFENEIILKDYFKEKLRSNFVSVISNEEKVSAEARKGFITGDLLVDYLGDLTKDYHLYICGPLVMMTNLTKDLLKRGVSPDRIHKEEFSL